MSDMAGGAFDASVPAWPSGREALRLAAWMTCCCALIGWAPFWFSGAPFAWSAPVNAVNREWMMLVMLTAPVATVMIVACGWQRLEIGGGAIRVANLASLYRRRAFHAHEVEEMRLVFGTGEALFVALELRLCAAPHRKWRSVRVSGFKDGSECEIIDNRFFLAIASTLAAFDVRVLIHNLPKAYAGPLASFRRAD